MKRIVSARESKADLKRFLEVVQKHIGVALMVAQMGDKHPDAKPMRGFGGASVIEVIEDHDGDTYRAVYTVRSRRHSTSCIASKRNRDAASPQTEGKSI